MWTHTFRDGVLPLMRHKKNVAKGIIFYKSKPDKNTLDTDTELSEVDTLFIGTVISVKSAYGRHDCYLQA